MKQRVEYLDGENGEDELYERYGRGDVNYPDTFTVVPSGEYHPLMTWKSTSASVPKKANTGEDRTIIIDHPGCYDRATIPHRMQKFYKSLKSIIVNYRQGGHCLTVFVLSFVNTDKPWKPVYSEDIIGTEGTQEYSPYYCSLVSMPEGRRIPFP